MQRPLNHRMERALRVTQWADRPLRWAVRLSLAPMPFHALRRVPLWAICKAMEMQVLAAEKIAR